MVFVTHQSSVTTHKTTLPLTYWQLLYSLLHKFLRAAQTTETHHLIATRLNQTGSTPRADLTPRFLRYSLVADAPASQPKNIWQVSTHQHRVHSHTTEKIGQSSTTTTKQHDTRYRLGWVAKLKQSNKTKLRLTFEISSISLFVFLIFFNNLAKYQYLETATTRSGANILIW